MPTTITINEKTKERLSDYKFGDWIFDTVLNTAYGLRYPIVGL